MQAEGIMFKTRIRKWFTVDMHFDILQSLRKDFVTESL